MVRHYLLNSESSVYCMVVFCRSCVLLVHWNTIMQWTGISSQLSPMMPRPFSWVGTVKMESIILRSIWRNSFQSALSHVYQDLILSFCIASLPHPTSPVLETCISFLASEDSQTAGIQAERNCPFLTMLEAETQLLFSPKVRPRHGGKQTMSALTIPLLASGGSSVTGPQDISYHLGQYLQTVSTRGFTCLSFVWRLRVDELYS